MKEAREHLQKVKLSSDEKIQKLHERIRKAQDAAREAQKSASPRSPRTSGKPKRKDKGSAGSASKSKTQSPSKASHKHNGSKGKDEIVAAQAKASRRGFALANLQKNTMSVCHVSKSQTELYLTEALIKTHDAQTKASRKSTKSEGSRSWRRKKGVKSRT